MEGEKERGLVMAKVTREELQQLKTEVLAALETVRRLKKKAKAIEEGF